MKRYQCFPVMVILGCSFFALQPARSAEEGQPKEPVRQERRWTRDWSMHKTNNASVKSAFREAISDASAATVKILSDGKPTAMGIVLDRDGHIVTKASDLLGELTCQTGDDGDHGVTLVGTNESHDLAVLKIDAKGLKPAEWRLGDVPLPGSLIASVAPEDELLSVGVVSSGTRRIGGSTKPEGRRGRLGVSLGNDETGITIKSVASGSGAMKAGIQAGDRLLRIDGVTMTDYDHVIETVGAHPPGRTIRLVLQREDKELELSATLGKPETRPLPQDHWGGGPFSARRSGFPTVLPHDSVVRPTQCGGPLVDTDGKIVGINIARALRVTTYAIPADVVLEVSRELLAGSE